jgi:hypothetical protein
MNAEKALTESTKYRMIIEESLYTECEENIKKAVTLGKTQTLCDKQLLRTTMQRFVEKNFTVDYNLYNGWSVQWGKN